MRAPGLTIATFFAVAYLSYSAPLNSDAKKRSRVQVRKVNVDEIKGTQSDEEKPLLRVPKVREDQIEETEKLEKALLSEQHFTSIDGDSTGEGHNEEIELHNGDTVKDINQHSKTENGQTQVETEVNIPALGVHGTYQKTGSEEVPIIPEDDLTIDFSPKAVAEYLLATDDFSGFDAALEDLVNSSMMTSKEARAYKKQVINEFTRLMQTLQKSREREEALLASGNFQEDANVNEVNEKRSDIPKAEPDTSQNGIASKQIEVPSGVDVIENEQQEGESREDTVKDSGKFRTFDLNKAMIELKPEMREELTLGEMIEALRVDLLKTMLQTEDLKDVKITEADMQGLLDLVAEALLSDMSPREQVALSEGNIGDAETDVESELENIKGNNGPNTGSDNIVSEVSPQQKKGDRK
ncbi:unnamed protein product [Owenia fusiformis]|uniref:Uncharacterized protein n=1 Tax=Owenia fusiformis TaxID=6347 RepID=A0A8J1UH88_OWEFU|nr:unnamed protein product [Owenia fusiformis]